MSSGQDQFILQLFDNLWFKNGVLSNPSRNNPVLVAPANKNCEEDDPAAAVPRLSRRAPSMIGRSSSYQALSSKDVNQSDSDSSSTPKSVLQMRPTLDTILSGKEVGGEDQFAQLVMMTDNGDGGSDAYKKLIEKRNSRSRNRRRGRRRKYSVSSRSLSELEYEELKGFLDLGFVFSDEDKDSSLVSIIPGLQKFGENNKPLLNWRIPAFGNEMELKHHLKFWAQTVASTVR